MTRHGIRQRRWDGGRRIARILRIVRSMTTAKMISKTTMMKMIDQGYEISISLTPVLSGGWGRGVRHSGKMERGDGTAFKRREREEEGAVHATVAATPSTEDEWSCRLWGGGV